MRRKTQGERKGSRDYMEGSPLFALNVFIDWKRLFPAPGNDIWARAGPRLKKDWLNTRSDRAVD